MGGGKKKQSLKQMTKRKAPKESKQKEKESKQPTVTKKPSGITLPDINDKKVLSELKGLKILTPSIVASRYNIRLSLASKFLKELEKRKMAEYITGGKNLKIYKILS